MKSSGRRRLRRERSKRNWSTRRDLGRKSQGIRLTNGSALVETFPVTATLQDVVAQVAAKRSDGQGPFSLMTTFPRKVYGPSDYGKTLKDLGLVPSAVLILTK
eukprot:Colp12_sorted_trinity150504_noHs@14441